MSNQARKVCSGHCGDRSRDWNATLVCPVAHDSSTCTASSREVVDLTLYDEDAYAHSPARWFKSNEDKDYKLSARNCKYKAGKVQSHYEKKGQELWIDDGDDDDDDYYYDNRRQQENHDLIMARNLQSEEKGLLASYQRSQREAEQSMLSSTTGKAWKFVAEVLDLYKRLSYHHNDTTGTIASSASASTSANRPYYNIAPMALDDLVFTTERMLEAQDLFRAEGRPVTVDIGYHYTSSACLSSIQRDGLLSRPERNSIDVRNTQFHGASFGEGIYTTKDVSTVHGSYGDVGLLVVRLRGHVALSPQGHQYDCNNNSIMVTRSNNEKNFLVLQKSYQCIPLIRFATNFVTAFQPDLPGNKIVHEYHSHLQKLCDNFFNGHFRTVVDAPSSSRTDCSTLGGGAASLAKTPARPPLSHDSATGVTNVASTRRGEHHATRSPCRRKAQTGAPIAASAYRMSYTRAAKTVAMESILSAALLRQQIRACRPVRSSSAENPQSKPTGYKRSQKRQHHRTGVNIRTSTSVSTPNYAATPACSLKSNTLQLNF